eukprot:gene25140-31286_t
MFKQAVVSAKPVVNGVLLTLSVVASVKLVTDYKGTGNLIAKHYKTTPPVHHED